MKEYLRVVDHVLTSGEKRQGPKPVGTLAIFGMEARYDLREGFPLVTTRDMRWGWRNIIIPELLWILSGSTNVKDLNDLGSKLWDKWSDISHKKLGYENGELGPIYGKQLRNFSEKTDQVARVRDMLKRDPQNRRSMISFWNLGDVEDHNGNSIVDVAPCITLLHFAEMNGRLDMIMTQRSADIPIGVPHDIAEWSLFQIMMAKQVDLVPGFFVHQIHDGHIYEDQIPAMELQLKREPIKLPSVRIDHPRSGSIFEYKPDDFHLHDYHPHPVIKIPVAD